MSRDAAISQETFDAIKESVRMITNLLAMGEWQAIENMTDGRRLSSDDLRSAVVEYGGTLVPIPDFELARLEIVHVSPRGLKSFRFSRSRQMFAVAVPLWTKEEGRSDLFLELSLSEEDGLFEIEIDNLHVS